MNLGFGYQSHDSNNMLLGLVLICGVLQCRCSYTVGTVFFVGTNN